MGWLTWDVIWSPSLTFQQCVRVAIEWMGSWENERRMASNVSLMPSAWCMNRCLPANNHWALSVSQAPKMVPRASHALTCSLQPLSNEDTIMNQPHFPDEENADWGKLRILPKSTANQSVRFYSNANNNNTHHQQNNCSGKHLYNAYYASNIIENAIPTPPVNRWTLGRLRILSKTKNVSDTVAMLTMIIFIIVTIITAAANTCIVLTTDQTVPNAVPI